jgi:hypothetical protein
MQIQTVLPVVNISCKCHIFLSSPWADSILSGVSASGQFA